MTVQKIATIHRYIGLAGDTKPTTAPVGSTFLEHDTDAMFITHDGGSTWVQIDKLVKLVAGTAAIGKLAANDGVDIGNVDVASLPAGNLGQQAMAASVSVVPASNVTDATYIGDIKFGEALPAGTASVGGVKDDGPQVAGTRTLTTSADMTTTANISGAPTAGQKLVLREITISVDTAMNVIIEEETSGTDYLKFFLPANGTVVYVPRYPPKLATADKKWNAVASVAGNIAISTVTTSEA